MTHAKNVRYIPYVCFDCKQEKIMITSKRRSIPKGGLSCGEGSCLVAHNARAMDR